MHRLRIIVALCLSVASPLRAQDALRTYELDAAGHHWTVTWWGPDGAVPRPLVLVFHGAGGNGRAYLEKNGWFAKARAEGFIVAAPDGLPARPERASNFLVNPRLWNSGQLTAGSPRAQVDDIAFVRALLDDLARRAAVDTSRIFVTGHSNGAAMSFALAVALGDRIAAIAPVMGLNYQGGRAAARAVPTLYLIGDADKLNPVNGGESRLPWGARTTPPVEQGIAAWATTLGCGGAPVTVRDTDTLTARRWSGCRDGATFEQWTLHGQGHGWPGGRESGLPDRMLGPSRNAVDATSEVWRFFASIPPRARRGRT